MTPSKIKSAFARRLYSYAEWGFRKLEKSQLSRGSVLVEIPPNKLRGGGLGTVSYTEWGYTIGQMQSLVGLHIRERPLRLLDVGCGVGRLYLASKPFIGPNDNFTGIDVTEKSIDICKSLYERENVKFIHTPAHNAVYGKKLVGQATWPLADASMSLVTALSVWTHLNEQDAHHYLGEVSRVMQPGARAIISFFVLDDHYRPQDKSASISRFYPQPENTWIFDIPAYESKSWLYPAWARFPETAIAIELLAFQDLIASVGLKLGAFYPGQWKEYPGIFFQDIAVLEKPE